MNPAPSKLKAEIVKAVRHAPLRTYDLAKRCGCKVGEVKAAADELVALGLLVDTADGWTWPETERTHRARPSRVEAVDQLTSDLEAARLEISAQPGERASLYQAAAMLPAWRWKRATRALREAGQVTTTGTGAHVRWWPVAPDASPPAEADASPPATVDASQLEAVDVSSPPDGSAVDDQELGELRELRSFVDELLEAVDLPPVVRGLRDRRSRLAYLAGAARVAS